jgi:putative tryptophan/tyrosine transport system substrate-binding protein
MRRRDFVALLSALARAWPLVGRGQQKAMPVIGFLGSTSPGPNAPLLTAFREGLSEAGYIEGENVAIEYRWTEGRTDPVPALIADLVGCKVDVIASTGADPPALAAKNATSTIPIVFVIGGDPVAAGLVASLARPGRNITGFTLVYTELNGKRLELLAELVPQARRMALLVNPNSPETEILDMRKAAQAKGVQLAVLKASTESEIDGAFTTLVQLQAGGLIVDPDPFFCSRVDQLVVLAAHYAVTTIYYRREFVAAGGLISYGTSRAAVYRQAGIYVGRILKGEKPADLPVQQPTTFELVVNLNAAKALGLTVPPWILARADEVIE